MSVLPVLAYLVVALQRIGYPYELSYFEGSTVEVAARVTDGLPLYGPPSTDFVPWPYPPLYFWLSGNVFHVTGVSLTAMRAVSLLASVAAIVLLGLIVRRVTGDRTAAMVAAGLFAATYWVSDLWFDTARVDSLLIALLLAAVLAATYARGGAGGGVVGLLVVAAFLTKQNALVAAAPLLVWLVVRRPRAGWVATAVTVGGSLLSVLAGDLVTGGWYSRSVLLQLVGHGVVARWLVNFWVADVVLPFAVVLAALAWLGLRRGRRPIPRWRLPDAGPVYAAVAGLWLAGVAGRLHEGGGGNVAIPAHAGTALLVGVAVAAALGHADASRVATAMVLSVAVALQSAVLVLWNPRPLPTAADRAAGDRLVALLASLPDRVLVPSHPYYLRLADRPGHASLIAVNDMLATRPGPARDALQRDLPWSLTGVSALVLDSADDAHLFGPALQRDFTLVSTRVVPDDALEPVADVATRPALLYVRTSRLPDVLPLLDRSVVVGTP